MVDLTKKVKKVDAKQAGQIDPCQSHYVRNEVKGSGLA